MTGTYGQSASTSTTTWRIALLVLAIVLGLTNVVELSATFRPDYWEHYGLIGISGSEVNGKLRISPDAFFQTNTEMAEILYGLAIEYAGLRGFERVYDLYCGIGTIGLAMAPRAA